MNTFSWQRYNAIVVEKVNTFSVNIDEDPQAWQTLAFSVLESNIVVWVNGQLAAHIDLPATISDAQFSLQSQGQGVVQTKAFSIQKLVTQNISETPAP